MSCLQYSDSGSASQNLYWWWSDCGCGTDTAHILYCHCQQLLVGSNANVWETSDCSEGKIQDFYFSSTYPKRQQHEDTFLDPLLLHRITFLGPENLFPIVSL